MSNLTICPTSPAVNVMRPLPLTVHIDGRRRRDLHVQGWSVLPAPDFGCARIALAMSRASRLEEIAAIAPVASRLQIRQAGPYEWVVFDGYVARYLLGVGPDAEHIGLEAREALGVHLKSPLNGRWQVNAAAAAFVPTAECVFNDGPNGFASETTFTINSRPCRIFQPGSAGTLWSVADILRYLLAAFVPADISAWGLDELEGDADAILPPRTALTGLSVCEAIARVAALAGLAVRSGRGEDAAALPGLVFYSPGRTGRRRAIRLQQPGEALDARRSNLWKGKIVLRRGPARPGQAILADGDTNVILDARRPIVVLGSSKRYESTFTLKPGWDPNLESSDYRDFVRDEASSWATVADVFRKWVLNESGRYSDAPCNLDTFDFSTIDEDDFFLTTARRLEPCLSVDKSGESLGIVVEVSYDSGSTWRRYGGPVRVSHTECTVYLADDALPGDYFQAALAQTAGVRVTGVVDSDRHLSAEIVGDPARPARIVRIPSARWYAVHGGSVFHGRQDFPDPLEQDDTLRLAQLAENLSESDASAVEADLTLGWLDPTCNVGDIVQRIEGRPLELPAMPGSSAHVRSVEHRCGRDWTTHLKVSG